MNTGGPRLITDDIEGWCVSAHEIEPLIERIEWAHQNRDQLYADGTACETTSGAMDMGRLPAKVDRGAVSVSWGLASWLRSLMRLCGSVQISVTGIVNSRAKIAKIAKNRKDRKADAQMKSQAKRILLVLPEVFGCEGGIQMFCRSLCLATGRWAENHNASVSAIVLNDRTDPTRGMSTEDSPATSPRAKAKRES